MASVFVKYLFLVSFVVSGCAAQLKKLQRNHTPQQLSNSDVRYLAGLSDPSYTNYVLDKILIPRVVGTPNHELVFNFITSQLEKLGWDIEVDEFQEKTPNFGILTFKNIVATLNPHAERYLVLACHYDSKYFEKEIFVGATDSAVPCAMMLNLATVMHRELNQTRDSELSLKLIFFDGEEAFVNWGPKDSIYGAKHLAAKYHNDVKVSRLSGENVSELDKIDMLVLLDLIGHKDITFYSYFQETGNWYLRLCDAEDQLDKLGLMTRHRKYFLRRMSYGRIEDDHLPFLRKNVPILHLIASPFPREWHTPGDNRDIIDENAVENINKILRIFIAEYFHIYLSDHSEEKMLPEKEL